MKTIFMQSIICMFLVNNVIIGQYSNIDYNQYIYPRNIILFPTYMNYLNLGTVATSTQFHFIIRQAATKYPGDYFYPPDAYIPKQFIAKDLYSQLTQSEIDTVKEFLSSNLPPRFLDSLVLSSLKCYNFTFPNGLHREPYAMFSSDDTVYVISGWLGKFLSFYRVIPGENRLTVPELMKDLDGLILLSKEIRKDAFREQSDSLNYLLEYMDKDRMFRVRNYLMKTVLPPDLPESPEKFYNLIEITKFYDKEAIP